MPNVRWWFLRLSLLTGGLVCGLVVAELGLRVAGVSFPAPYFPDTVCGTRLRPNWSGWFSQEGRAFVRTNQAGFRDRDHTLAKPADTLRIVVLGDSYVEAAQVDQSETFWAVLESELQRCPTWRGRTVEVLAFGVSGWGTAQELLALRHYALAYQPDLVLLAFLSGNDVRNNLRDLEPEQVRPYFTLRDEELVLDDSFLTHPSFVRSQSRWVRAKVALINHSRLLQLVQKIRNRRAMARASSNPRAGLDDEIFAEPPNDTWRRAWDVTERLIGEMQQDVRQHGARFCLATVTNGIDVHPDVQTRAAYAKRLGIADFGYAERRLQALGERLNFPVIALSEPMRRHAEREREYLHGFSNTILGEGHWNAAGHRLAGRLIAKTLCEEHEK